MLKPTRSLPQTVNPHGKRLRVDRGTLILASEESANILRTRGGAVNSVHRGTSSKAEALDTRLTATGHQDPIASRPKTQSPKPGSAKPRSALQVAIFFVREFCLKGSDFGASGSQGLLAPSEECCGIRSGVDYVYHETSSCKTA